MTEEERDSIKEEILEQIKFESSLIEELVPAVALKDNDKFELDNGRYVEFARLCSEIRLQNTLDKYRHVDRGPWMAGEEYYAGETNPYSGLIETSHVWYFGCKFRCLVTGTPNPPSWDCPDWEFEEGNPFLTLTWVGSEDSVFEENPQITLEVNAFLYNQDLTEDPRLKWDWTRQSWHVGIEDTVSDSIWNDAHANIGTNALTLVAADMNYQFGTRPEKLVYRVTATLLDEAGVPANAYDGTPMRQSMEIEI